MNVWILFLIIGGLTLVERTSFILLLENWNTPRWLTRSLKYVPVTIMLALASPSVLRTEGMIDISPLNPKVIAAALAVIVAWRTRNILLTIVIGMIGFWLSTWLLG